MWGNYLQAIDEFTKGDDAKFGRFMRIICNYGIYGEELAERAVIKRQKAEEENGADDASVHPLVKDKRFLKLSFFPDIIPDCFKEVD